jgi:hypothetical protein
MRLVCLACLGDDSRLFRSGGGFIVIICFQLRTAERSQISTAARELLRTLEVTVNIYVSYVRLDGFKLQSNILPSHDQVNKSDLDFQVKATTSMLLRCMNPRQLLWMYTKRISCSHMRL